MSEKYGLHDKFEEYVLYLASTSQKFWAKVGQHIDPEACELPLAKTVISTCRRIAKEDSGTGPGSSMIVIQRLKREVNSGKLTMETLQTVNDLFDRVEDLANPPPETQVVAQMVEVLRKQMNMSAIEAGIQQSQKGGDFDQVRQQFDRAARLGIADSTVTRRLGSSSLSIVANVRQLERMSYGIPELDARMDGGLPRQSFGVWLADSGAGKSMHLASTAGACMRAGVFTGFVTLELPEHIQIARIISHLTNVPISAIIDNPASEKLARQRLEMVEDRLGILAMTELAESATTLDDVERWVTETEQEYGEKMEVLVVDYADKMRAPIVRDGNEYQVMRHVYEGLHSVARERDMRVWSASQATRPGKDKSKYITQKHAADSMHKMRAADVVISINPDDTDEEGSSMYTYHVAKYRLGESGFSVGPIFVDYSMARVSPFAAEIGPW